MASKNKTKWTNPKYPKRIYSSRYENTKGGHRVLVLTAILKNGKPHVESFDSWQKAQAAKWVNV